MPVLAAPASLLGFLPQLPFLHLNMVPSVFIKAEEKPTVMVRVTGLLLNSNYSPEVQVLFVFPYLLFYCLTISLISSLANSLNFLRREPSHPSISPDG